VTSKHVLLLHFQINTPYEPRIVVVLAVLIVQWTGCGSRQHSNIYVASLQDRHWKGCRRHRTSAESLLFIHH